jgi:hypothetical protein
MAYMTSAGTHADVFALSVLSHFLLVPKNPAITELMDSQAFPPDMRQTKAYAVGR